MTRATSQGEVEIPDNRWKTPICFLYLMLGILISFVLFQSMPNFDNFGGTGISIHFSNSRSHIFSTTYLIIYPLCLFTGSMITGYLCQPYLSKPISNVFICSGLYMIALITPTQIVTSPNLLLKFLINPGILWIVASIGGVYLGRYFSRLLRANRKGQAMNAEE